MKAFVGWIIQIGIVLLLASSAYFVQYLNGHLSEKWHAEKASLDKTPLDQLRYITLEAEFIRQQENIKNITDFVVTRNDLVRVVSFIEERAEARNVSVRVPSIRERVVLDPVTGLNLAQSELMEDLEVDMNVSGNPDNLVNFLYDLEHSPYLLNLHSWEVSVSSSEIQSTARSTSALAPDSSEEVIQTEGQAVIKAILTVWRSEADVNN